MGWADRPSKDGALFVSAEDAIEELHRRLAAIIRTQRAVIGPDGLKSLDLLPLAGHDAILAAPKTNGGVLGETRLFEALEAEVDNLRPALLILDTLADLFGGDEIKRPHARQLIGMLRGLAIRYRLTILLLSHPSLSGMSSGADTSGSTAWSNSVRSRLYLESPKGADEDAGDDDRRILTTKKANYGRAGGSVALRWENGVFVPDRVSSAEQMYANVADESLFLEILAAFDRAGRPVSEKPSSTYAPHLFAGDPKAKGVGAEASGGRDAAHVLLQPPTHLRPADPHQNRAGGSWRGRLRSLPNDAFQPPANPLFAFQPPMPTPMPTRYRRPSNPLPSNPPYPPGVGSRLSRA